MPPISADAEEVTIYTWEDGWRVVRPLSQQIMANYMTELWHTVFHPDGERKTLGWRWPTDTEAVQRILGKLTTLQPTVMPRTGISPRAVPFVVLDPEGEPKAAMCFDPPTDSTPKDWPEWMPTLEAVFSVDGSRIVDSVLQGRVLEFVYGFVYAQLFGEDNAMSIIRDDAEWGMGVAPCWALLHDFEALVSGEARKAFDEAVPALSDPHNARRTQVLYAAVRPLIVEVGRVLNPANPSMSEWYVPQGIYTLRYHKKLHGFAESFSFVLEFDGADARNWEWRLGWEDLATRYVTWVATGQDIAELFVRAGLLADSDRYWKLIEGRMLEGAPTFDPELLEPYEMLRVLPPLFAEPDNFRAWWEAL